MDNTKIIPITDDRIIIHVIKKRSFNYSYRIVSPVHVTLIFLVMGVHNLRANISISLEAKDAKADIVGIISLRDTSNVQLHTLQHHRAPHTVSNLLVKSVLNDASVFQYDGSIIVDKHAQKTDAYQRNENLLLDPFARAVSSPALEIQANDVRCTHGAVIKTLNQDEVWYLSSRGIPKNIARDMIADGFMKSAYTQFVRQDIHERIAREVSRFS